MDKEALLAQRFAEGEVEVPGFGTLRVRGMSRWELATATKLLAEKGELAFEKWVLARTILEPTFTEAEIAQWQMVAGPTELVPVGLKVNELSGIGKDAAKSEVPGAGEQPGS